MCSREELDFVDIVLLNTDDDALKKTTINVKHEIKVELKVSHKKTSRNH